MLACNETQQRLRARFDAGLDLGGAESGHVETCIACQAYRERLVRLNDALFAMPLEPVPDALASGILHRVYESRQENRLSLADGATLLAALGAISAGLGWYFPAAIDPASWWSQAQAWLIGTESVWSVAFLFDRINEARAAIESGLKGSWMPSRTIVWPALVATFSGVIIFNGYVAMRLRTAGD